MHSKKLRKFKEMQGSKQQRQESEQVRQGNMQKSKTARKRSKKASSIRCTASRRGRKAIR